MTIVCLGGISLDIVSTVEALPVAGSCRKATSLAIGAGGKAANQAVAAARLGSAALLIGAVGDDDCGRLVRSALEAESVDVRHVSRIAASPTGAFVLVRDATGEKQAVVLPGANAYVTPELVEDAADVIAAGRALLVQLEIPFESVLRAARIAHDAAVPLIVDPSPPRELPDELLRLAAVIRLNAREAETVTGIGVRDRVSARAAASALLSRGVRLAAVEAGDEGNVFLTADEEIFIPKLAVPSIDRLGAGDALTAALAIALAERMPLGSAARFASAAAALTTRAPGAQTSMPTRAEVETLIRDE